MVVGRGEENGPMVGRGLLAKAWLIEGVYMSYKVDASDRVLKLLEFEFTFSPVIVFEDVGFERHSRC